MNNRISNETSKKITILNYICCILVVFIHSSGYKYFELNSLGFYGRITEEIIDFFTNDITEMSVSFFFFISGFLFFKDASVYGNSIDLVYFKEKWKKRIKTLLIPYLIWNTIWMLFIVIITNIPVIVSHIESLGLFEKSFSSVLQGIFLFRYAGITWYIFYLMIYMLLSPLIVICLRYKWGAILIIISFLFSGLHINIPGLVDPSHFNSLFFYVLGSYIALHKFNYFNQRYSKKMSFIGFIGLIFVGGGIPSWI